MMCKCPPDSPFHWREDPRPSIFYKDPVYRGTHDGKTFSQVSSELVEQSRRVGKMSGFIKGIGKSKEEEVLRMRRFTTYTLAVAADAERSKNTKVPPVRGVDGSRGDATR